VPFRRNISTIVVRLRQVGIKSSLCRKNSNLCEVSISGIIFRIPHEPVFGSA
jgi:hypothetical protein